MSLTYKITYHPNPARISDEELTAYSNAYSTTHGKACVFETVEDIQRKAKKRALRENWIKPQKTRAQKDAHNLASQIRTLAYKHHDAQYTVTHLAMYKREMQISRTAYYKSNKTKFAEMYNEQVEQKKKQKMLKYKREWNRNWRAANPEKSKAREQRYRLKEKTPEQLQGIREYAVKYREAHREEHKAYMMEYRRRKKEEILTTT